MKIISNKAKRLLATFALLAFVVSPFSSLLNKVAYAAEVLNEDFESVTTPSLPSGWTATSVNWGSYDTGGFYGKVLYGDFQNFPYTADEDSTVTSSALDLSGSSSGEVALVASCDSEYSDPATGDHMALEVSGDGTNFTELTRWNESTLDADTDQGGSAIADINESIPSQYLTSNFQLRFHWVTNSTDNAYDGCYVDNISVTKTSDGGGGTDTTAPVISGLSDDSTPTSSKTWTWSSDDASAQYRFVIDQNSSGSPTGAYGSVTTATQASGNGTYYIHVQARDAALNESTVVTVSAILENGGGGETDTTAPTITFSGATPANGSTVAGNSFDVDLSSSDEGGLHYSFVDFDNDLEFWLSDFNNGSPQDRSTNNSTITVNNQVGSSEGQYGGSLTFDGVDDFLSVDASYGNLSSFTNSVWIYPDAQNDDGVFLRFGDHEIQVVDDTSIRYWDTATSFDVENAITVNAWNHIVAVGDNGQLKLYVNGTLKGTFDLPGSQGPIKYIGQYWNDPENLSGFYKGNVDEVLVFSRALSEAEIDSLGSSASIQYSHTFASLEDGAHAVKGYAVDVAGNTGMTETRTISTGGTDTTAPVISGLSDDSTPTSSKTWTWSSDDASAQYRFVIDQNSSGSPTGAYGSVTTATQASGNGTYYIHVQARDAALNESTVVTVSAILENEDPIVSFSSVTASPSSGTLTPGNSLHIHFQESHDLTTLELGDACHVNDVDVRTPFYNLGGGDYKVVYTVGANDTNRSAGQIPIHCTFRDTVTGATTTVNAFTDSNTVAIQTGTGGGNTTGGTIDGTVEGGTGILGVTSIENVDGTAIADGTFTNGWEYIFNITVPTNEHNLAMKFANWVMNNNASNTIAVANNVRISSPQADNGGATILITAADTYSNPLHMTEDLNPSMDGLQVRVRVEVAVPAGTSNGTYTTQYGVRTQE